VNRAVGEIQRDEVVGLMSDVSSPPDWLVDKKIDQKHLPDFSNTVAA
jgi:hypothetical protein